MPKLKLELGKFYAHADGYVILLYARRGENFAAMYPDYPEDATTFYDKEGNIVGNQKDFDYPLSSYKLVKKVIRK